MHARPSSAECDDSGAAGWAAARVSACATVELRAAEIPRLRDLAVPEGAPALPPRFLRHADEQTVVGMRAVLAAIAGWPGPRPSFAGHGVVAAPCRSGRFAAAQSLTLFREGGGVTVSPHVVPQCSLHSLAGAVSVALGMHGPNIGVGGGRHAVVEGLAAALSLLAPATVGGSTAPGAWFVATAWDEEPPLDATGRPRDESAAGGAAAAGGSPLCRGIAIALEPEAAADAATHAVARLVLAPPRRGRQPRDPAVGDAAAPMDHGAGRDERITSADDIRRLARGIAARPFVAFAIECPWGDEFVFGPAPAAAASWRRAA